MSGNLKLNIWSSSSLFSSSDSKTYRWKQKDRHRIHIDRQKNAMIATWNANRTPTIPHWTPWTSTRKYIRNPFPTRVPELIAGYPTRVCILKSGPDTRVGYHTRHFTLLKPLNQRQYFNRVPDSRMRILDLGRVILNTSNYIVGP